MDFVVLLVFVAVYVGMMLGRFPGLALDRTGAALLGAVMLLASDRMTSEQAWASIDVPTIGLLLGLMIVSAQFRLAGVYDVMTRRLAEAPLSPVNLLGLLILVAGGLSAVLANDIVCLAMTPILIQGCLKRRMDPLPFLLGLACAANVGSAATLIGNPQNMLIGQKLSVSFAGYLLDAVVPAILGMLATWGIIAWMYRGRWIQADDAPVVAMDAGQLVGTQPVRPWHAGKATAILLGLVIAFIVTDWPRDVMALAAGGLILLSRHTATHKFLDLVDWQLLVLFISLFIVNHALEASGWLAHLMGILRDTGVDLSQPATLFGVTAVLSNLVSNVPAVMLLLPAADGPAAPAILALSSTLAGNFILVGSIANLIVVSQAQKMNVRITFWEHAKTGIPVTLATLALAGLWLWIRY